MEEPEQNIPAFRDFPSKIPHSAWFLILVTLLTGCSGSDTNAINPTTSASFNALKQSVAEIRGLPFTRDVTIDEDFPEPRDSGSDRNVNDEYAGQPIPQIERVYKRLGLLGESTDLARALTEFSRLQRLTFYDMQRQAIRLAPSSAQLGRALAQEGGPNAEKVPVVLALTQALQDQHFGWHERIKLIALEDRKLTFRGLAQGDAVLTALSYLAGTPRITHWAEQEPAIGRLVVEIEKLGADLPEFLRRKLVFPYRDGTEFVQWAHAAKGWDGVNALYADPPLSTAQIIHPEKYFRQRQDPLVINPVGLAEQIKETALFEQTLGESVIQLILSAGPARTEAAQLASGWRGDHLAAYPDGDNLNTIWFSAWETDERAAGFMRAYQSVLEQRHGLHFEAIAGHPETVKADFRGGRSTLLQRKGSLVLLVDDLASTKALEFAEQAWTDLEVNPEITKIPFDFAKNQSQWSSNRR